MKKYSIIVAGGKGLRMGSELPKQFIELKGLPILMHTINKFHEADSSIQIIVSLPKDQLNFWSELIEKHQFTTPHQVVTGGDSRYQSVDNALQYISTSDCLIAIHDGVRPLVSTEVILKSYTCAEEYGAAIPTVDLKESIREVNQEGNFAKDRSSFKLVQTPQTFRGDVILSSFENGYQEVFTDDASVAEFSQHKMHLFDGNYENIKVTTPEDLKLGEVLC